MPQTYGSRDARTTRQEDAASRRPIILLTPDLDLALPPEGEPTYHVRANYAEAINRAGGIALIAPYDSEHIETLLELADGITITGSRPGAQVAPARRNFERDLIARAIETGKPLLGICHGMQLMGECLGGTILSELPPAAGEHMPQAIPNIIAHDLLVEPGGLLDGEQMVSGGVNSLHRHALSGEGRFQVVARAPDGVVEAIQGNTAGYCLGVQWHPEYALTTLDREILRSFVRHCAAAAEPSRPRADGTTAGPAAS